MCKGGVFYFARHVPNDLQRHHEILRIVIRLKTHSQSAALKASRSTAAKLDGFWLQMRVANMDLPASAKLTKQQPKETFSLCAPNLSDDLQQYFKLKGIDKLKLFFTASKRNVDYAIKCLADRPIDTYTTADAAALKDWLTDKKLSTASIKHIFSTFRAVFHLTIHKDGFDCKNAFARTFLTSDERPKRTTISPDCIKCIQQVCLNMADERRLLVALLSDTGMRLSEAIWLIWEDIHLDHETPHISLKPHPWRRLKTAGSERLIPLVGGSLAAVKVMHRQSTTQFLFPSCANEIEFEGNSCSASFNNRLKQYVPDAVIHSFRHSFHDRLRNAGVESEIIDQLSGWSRKTVGQGYGDGFALPILYNQTLSLKN